VFCVLRGKTKEAKDETEEIEVNKGSLAGRKPNKKNGLIYPNRGNKQGEELKKRGEGYKSSPERKFIPEGKTSG